MRSELLEEDGLMEPTKDTCTFVPPPNPWARISEIAARVGVRPHDGKASSICVTGADGKDYNVWEVIAAVLDRIGEDTKPHGDLLAEAIVHLNNLLNTGPQGTGSFQLTPLLLARDRAEMFLSRHKLPRTKLDVS